MKKLFLLALIAASALAHAEKNDPLKASVVKIRGESPSCSSEGSGFVVAPNRVLTPAQIVAGGETFTIEVDGQTLDAHVVSYDPHRGLAILEVPDVPAAPLPFAAEAAGNGSDAILLGYSDGGLGDFAATPARIREIIQLSGPDVDRTTTVSREVYIIRGGAKDASGGPLIDRDGHVLGVSFGASIDDPDTSFVMTAHEIAPPLADLPNTVPDADRPRTVLIR